MPARRARIVELLSEAYARDDLEQAEFERRLELAERAGTIEELEELVSNFPAGIVSTTERPLPVKRGDRLTGNALESEITRLDGLIKKPAKQIGTIEGTEERSAAAPAPTVVVTGFKLIGDTVVVEE